MLINIQKADVKAGNAILFRQLDFEVRKGEHWAIVGASGSGKTALLDTIAGKYFVANGELNIAVTSIAKVSTRHQFRNLSNTTDFYYQQRFNSTDSEDAATVIQYLRAIENSAPGNYWSLYNVLDELQLTKLSDKQLIKLSNGETKRLLIAAALVQHPALLLLDMPLTGLDVAARAGFDQLLEKIIASGSTIITATSPDEIPSVITHICVLDNRKIIAILPKPAYDPGLFALSTPVAAQVSGLASLLPSTTDNAYPTIVEMRDIVVCYGDKLILDHVSWTIRQGEQWALLGANGAGKSTLLSLINGDNPQAYANKISLFGRPRGTGESIWDIKKKIGYVSPELFQYFPPGISCQEVIESGLYDTMGVFTSSAPGTAALVEQWMHVFGISLATQSFDQVSTGIQRRCLLARAMIKNPVLLILDEPCQGFDEQQLAHFKQLIQEIAAHSALTMIYVSHYEDEIPASVSKRLVLKNGKAMTF